jgi:hypothetical protein
MKLLWVSTMATIPDSGTAWELDYDYPTNNSVILIPLG